MGPPPPAPASHWSNRCSMFLPASSQLECGWLLDITYTTTHTCFGRLDTQDLRRRRGDFPPPDTDTILKPNTHCSCLRLSAVAHGISCCFLSCKIQWNGKEASLANSKKYTQWPREFCFTTVIAMTFSFQCHEQDAVNLEPLFIVNNNNNNNSCKVS